MLKNGPFLIVIGNLKKVFFEKKSVFIFLLNNFWTLLPKTDFLLPDHLFWIADNS